MIIYNVTLNVDTEVHQEWLTWMKEVHIPDVMATGLMLDCRLCRVLAEDEGGVTFAVQYTCADMATYERYRAEHAPRLQAETQKHYGGRFAAFRTLLEVLHTS
ncbi:MAG TPA: DUF4286 family protein [Flavobacteriales bacterium]|nr:DUF4286 family protein [Flavobacteriales bacterium]HNU55384.1 DUF4286 family protein [Flavobacteriales bacterium]